MKFTKPAGPNPTDKQNVIGQSHTRFEGALKTTGTAKYAYENNEAFENPAYGYMVGASIAKGKIKNINKEKTTASPGVITVITYEDAGKLKTGEFFTSQMLAGPKVDHYHQTVALVVAETFEQARAAAELLEIEYTEEKGVFDLQATKDADDTFDPKENYEPQKVGDFEKAFKNAEVKLDEIYTTPDQSQAMMEPHSTIANWEGDKLTCYNSVQVVNWAVRDVAKILGLKEDNIRIISPYVGGGFGSKLSIQSDIIVAAIAAKAIGRAVKVTIQRPLIFNNTSHRPATIQRIRFGADTDGKITAVGHESWSGNLEGGVPEETTTATKLFYAGENRMTKMSQSILDLPEGNSMRAPGEAPGLMVLEMAMDELAEKLQMDPVELRIKNDIQVDPSDSSVPFSTRLFVECLEKGVEEFNWKKRKAEPGSVTEGDWLIGMGVAGAIRGAPINKSGAMVRLDKNGKITVETNMTDIGTGSYTIIAQTAAEMMGVEMSDVDVKLGDSKFPASSGSGGQWGAASSTSGVYAACVKLREMVAKELGLDPEEVEFSKGKVTSGEKSVALKEAAQSKEMVAEDEITYGDLDKKYAQNTFGAHFVEVGVNKYTCEIRVRRMLAVCHAGRILNPLTARSQMIGAMTMGVGAALMEELVVDKIEGFFVNHNLADYEVPTHADISHQDVIMLEDADSTMSPMKAKGIGELGIVGVAAAVANAVYNATGVRVRDYPITLDKIIGKMKV